MRRPVLFYAAWPIGYFNFEPERKARGLAEAGYDVLWVPGVGIRNPSFSNLGKLADRTRRRLNPGASPPSGDRALPTGLRQGAVLVAPPRQLAAMRRLNARWLERQLRRQIEPWSQTLAWVRWPTPELVDSLARLRPARLVYEAVDAYDDSPGIIGRWATIFARYERRLVSQADIVVVPGERLAERYRQQGADVRLCPHGVDLGETRGPRRRQGPVVVGFAGTIDKKLDVDILRAVAQRHPEWRLRLVGPVQDGFDRRAVADLPNLSLDPPIPASEVPLLIATFDLGFMPYEDSVAIAHSVPLKNLEYMAAGVPAVTRPIPALDPFAEHLYYASTPAEFVQQLERALSEDTPERALARRRIAEANAWPGRIAEIVALADELSGGPEVELTGGPEVPRAG